MKIGYQGDIGSNSEAAALEYINNNDLQNVEIISLLDW